MSSAPTLPLSSVANTSMSPALDTTVLLNMHRVMCLIRAWDQRALKLQRSGRISFCVTSQGEEATQVGTAAALQDCDWLFPSYRQYGLAMWRGASLEAMAHQLFGTENDIVKGRQMPCHYSFSQHRFVSISSVIGTQISQAVGAAVASQIKGEPEVTAVYFGDGATSANDFHAGMNFAGVYKAPVLFMCVNNQYAISLPVSKQTAAPTLADKAKAYGFPGLRVDGNDVLAVYEATKAAAERARKGEGPTLLELLTYRVDPHSSSDDPSRYRATDEQKHWQGRDPIAQFEAYLLEQGVAQEVLEHQREQAEAQVLQATHIAEKAAKPPLESLFEGVYEDVPPSLQAQMEECLTHDAGLQLSNSGEFPL